MRSEVSAFATIDEAMMWIHTLMHKMGKKQLSQLLFYIETLDDSKNEVVVVAIQNYTKISRKDLVEKFMELPGGK